jgi:hypothetical protein
MVISMEYIIKTCPKCNQELPVPTELRECICMYCGAHFNMEEPNTSEIEAADPQVIEESYQLALEQIESLVQDYDALLLRFTKEAYTNSFLEYSKLGESILIPAEHYAALSEQSREQVLQDISGRLIRAIEQQIEGNKGILFKKSKAVLIDQHRFFLAVYLVPMLNYLKLELSDSLTDRIMMDWIQRHPKSEFKKATYEELSTGFLRKGFCFITTAVCDTLGKPEDCYELERFREFRDHFLLGSEEGRRLVEEYYAIAPRIVTYLNMHSDSSERYHWLWNTYLRPCLTDLELGHKKRCRNRYIRMVRKLSAKLPI